MFIKVYNNKMLKEKKNHVSSNKKDKALKSHRSGKMTSNFGGLELVFETCWTNENRHDKLFSHNKR